MVKLFRKQISIILVSMALVLILSSFASAYIFQDTWDRPDCAGDCWNISDMGGSDYFYLNPANADYKIQNGIGYMDDGGGGGGAPQALINLTTPITNDSGLVTVNFQWKLDNTNYCGFGIINKSISSGVFLSPNGVNLRLFNGSDWFNLGTPITINTWHTYTYFLNTSNNSAVLYIDGIKNFTFTSSFINRLDRLTFYSDGVGADCDGYWDNMTIGRSDNFTIQAKDSFTGAYISNFLAYLNGTLYNTTTFQIDTGINKSKGHVFDIEVSSPTHLNRTYTAYNTSSNLIASLSKPNHLNIYIRNEKNNEPIMQNITLGIYSNVSEHIYSTRTSFKKVQTLPNNDYVLKATSINWSTRTYNLTLFDSPEQDIYVYLTNESNTVTFTAKDYDTGILLEDCGISMYKLINGSWQVVESHFTDITGKAQFHYAKDVYYKFFVTKTGYDNKMFELDPIVYPEYDIKLKKSITYFEVPVFTGVSLGYEPRIFYANTNNNFTFFIHSPDGLLYEYGFNLDFPGGNQNRTGTNQQGQGWEINFTIGNTPIGSMLNITYFFNTSNAGYNDYSYNYEIINYITGGNYTIMQNRNKTYGLGLFERSLISTLITLFIAGIGGLVAGGIIGLALALIIMGYMVYIGFVPIWSILISVLIGFMVVAWRSWY